MKYIFAILVVLFLIGCDAPKHVVNNKRHYHSHYPLIFNEFRRPYVYSYPLVRPKVMVQPRVSNKKRGGK